MKSVGFLILFVINLFGLSCEGKALPQSNETTVIPDSTVRLNWTFAGDPSEASLVWFFTSRRVGSKEEEIAGKYRTRPVHIWLGSLPGVAVELTPPCTTLVLKNVDERYNGIYRFSVQALAGGAEALVELYIAEKPNVTFTCPSHNEVDKGDDFTCVCKGENGSPPANVTWYKDNVPIGATRMEENTLTLTSVNETFNGVYKCKARSHTNDSFADEKSIKLIVRQIKPKSTYTGTKTTASSPPGWLTVAMIGIISAVLMFITIFIAVMHMRFCKLKESGDGGQFQEITASQFLMNVYMRRQDNPIQGVITNQVFSMNVKTQQPGPSTATAPSGSTENSFAMDKHTNQGSPSPYPSLDTEAMQEPDMRTAHASIDPKKHAGHALRIRQRLRDANNE